MTTEATVFMCDCGHPESPHSSFTRGFGRDADGKTYCYDCCAEGDRRRMRETGRIVAYLSSDGNTVQNWPGTVLARVTQETKRRMYGCCVSDRTFIRAVAPDGSRWYGQGPGRGMYVNLRKAKS